VLDVDFGRLRLGVPVRCGIMIGIGLRFALIRGKKMPLERGYVYAWDA